METEKSVTWRVHQGRNIRRIRLEKNINQDVMADLVHMSQPTVSRYENMKEIDEETLGRFARALDVPAELLKTLEEDAPIVIFQENTTNVETNNGNVDNGYMNNANTFNPVEKIVELYERMLNEEKEKYASLEKRLAALEQKNK